MQTRKYPRTMQEAFGPYTSYRIDEPRETGYSAAWWAAIAIAAIVTGLIVWGQR
jgi:hypothetical protein